MPPPLSSTHQPARMNARLPAETGLTTVSIVIPVYNSASIAGGTLDRVVATCAATDWAFEVIVVDDASRDDSLRVLEDAAARHPAIQVIAMAANVGQHAALLAGLRASSADIVVCMDDDLQHPPEAIPRLVDQVRAGHDAVFARFARSRHPGWRQVGSAIMRVIDRRVFGAPAGLAVSSFRAMRRDVVDRVCAYRGSSPYVRGQVLRAARTPANVDVSHGRRAGASSHTVAALVGTTVRVLFEWSLAPAWCAVAAGAAFLLVGVIGYRTADPAIRALAVLPLLHGMVLVGLGLAFVVARRRQERGVPAFEPSRDRT